MRMTSGILLIAVFAAAVSVHAAQADVKPAQLFTDNMVIQRETNAPVWGWAEAGEKVTVSASWGAEAATTADKDGKWMIKLQTPEAGGPHEIAFTGKNATTCKNVLSGDVWLCSGQSNMEMDVSRCNNPEEEAENSDFPSIRHFKVVRNATKVPAKDCAGDWHICSRETVKSFSAIAYFTGRDLHKELDIPIGLINSSWGGSSVETWTSVEAQKDDPLVKAQIKMYDAYAAKYKQRKARNYFDKAIKEWKEAVKKAEAEKKSPPSRPTPMPDPHKHKNCPSNLYNGMINPLVPYAVKGAIWYQGETNSNKVSKAEHYRVQLARLIKSWRAVWNQDLPFYFVQLTNYMKPQSKPVEAENCWPVTRESFVHVLRNVPDTGMVVAIDTGEEDDIHPKNKQDVGKRMASTILNKTYGKDTPTCPIYMTHRIDGDKIIITFEYTGSGLAVKGEGEELKTFAIAGADRNFVWAEAKINGNDVIVCSDQVRGPVAVRYAWADNPIDCNLYSNEGFPATPFRTDDWDLTK